jgi:uncharacterized membrane protein YkoI
MAMKFLWILAAAAVAAAAPANKPAELMKRVKIALPAAVEKAAPEVKDGTPFFARLKEVDGRLVYFLGFAQGETSVRVSVDAATSEIVTKTTEKKNHSKAISAAKISMAKAVEAAQAKVAGKASRVSFGLKKGKSVAEVIVVKDGKLFEVKLDGVTGAVLKVEEDDDDDDGDDDDDDEDDDD